MTAPQSDRPNEISRRRLRIVPPDAQRPDRLGTYVVSALEIDPRATDETLLATALEEQRTIITEDKDFGELVFVRRLDHPCIIRFMEIPVEDKVDSFVERPVRDGPWSARVSGREAPRAVGC